MNQGRDIEELSLLEFFSGYAKDEIKIVGHDVQIDPQLSRHVLKSDCCAAGNSCVGKTIGGYDQVNCIYGKYIKEDSQ